MGVVSFVSACKEPRDKEREKTGWRGKSNKVENVGTSHISSILFYVHIS